MNIRLPVQPLHAHAHAHAYRHRLRSRRMERCTVVILCTLGASISPCSAAETVAGLWRIEQARSEPILDKRRARIDFGADGTLSGHTSCNTLTARYTLDGSALKIGPVATSRMACAQLQMEQEDRIISALEEATSARVRDDGLLELRDADGRGLLRATRFEP